MIGTRYPLWRCLAVEIRPFFLFFFIFLFIFHAMRNAGRAASKRDAMAFAGSVDKEGRLPCLCSGDVYVEVEADCRGEVRMVDIS